MRALFWCWGAGALSAALAGDGPAAVSLLSLAAISCVCLSFPDEDPPRDDDRPRFA